MKYKTSRYLAITTLGYLAALSTNADAAPFNLNDCGNGAPCPYYTYGNANSYSLAVEAYIWDHFQGGGVGPSNPFYVPSTPGAIQNQIVVATGAGGTGVNTNFAGMDNAYPTPNNAQGITFFSTNKTAYAGAPNTSTIDAPADPGPAFSGNNPNTWDTTLAALSGFLGSGNTPVFFFNLNQVNSGASTNQDIAVWAKLILSNPNDPNLAPIYLDLTNKGGAYTDPGSGVFDGNAYAYAATGAGPNAGDNSATDYVKAQGQICLAPTYQVVPCSDPNAAITINQNLGANQAAFAVVVPELNDILSDPNFGGYTNLSLDLRMGCDPYTSPYAANCVGRDSNNGYEQVFISALASQRVPEPASISLVGLGLIGLAFAYSCRGKQGFGWISSKDGNR